MSILIRGMGMPKNGETITITICGDGIVFEEWKEPESVFKAVPVPKHGRLVEADTMKANVRGRLFEEEFVNVIDAAPTIIPAEEGE